MSRKIGSFFMCLMVILGITGMSCKTTNTQQTKTSDTSVVITYVDTSKNIDTTIHDTGEPSTDTSNIADNDTTQTQTPSKNTNSSSGGGGGGVPTTGNEKEEKETKEIPTENGTPEKAKDSTTPTKVIPNGLPHMDTALAYTSVREVGGNNRGFWIDIWNKKYGKALGIPWCATFVSFCLDQGRVSLPKVRSASSRAMYISGYSIPVNEILMGRYIPKRGTILVWANGNTWTGHTGFLNEDYKKNSFKTVEGNTSSGTSGSQRDGGGVYKRVRSIQPANYFRIKWVTPVSYK